MSLNELAQLLRQRAFVAGGLLVQDHEICLEAVPSKIIVGLQQFAHQGDFPDLRNIDQHDRQITGNTVRPQSCLPLLTLDQPLRRRTVAATGVKQVTGQFLHHPRTVRLDPQHTKLDLAMRPCKLQRPFDRHHFRVFLHQKPNELRVFSGRGREPQFCALARAKLQHALHGENRIQNETGIVGERARRIGSAMPAPKKMSPFGLVTPGRPSAEKPLRDVNGFLLWAAGASMRQQDLSLRVCLRHNKHLAECWVAAIRGMRGHGQLRIGSNGEPSTAPTSIKY